MRIVVGYDGSDAAKRALERAIELAGEQGEVVVVVSAEQHVRTVATGPHLDPSESQEQRGDLEEAERILSERGITAETVAAQGDPGNAIVERPRAQTWSSWAAGGSTRSSACCSGR